MKPLRKFFNATFLVFLALTAIITIGYMRTSINMANYKFIQTHIILALTIAVVCGFIYLSRRFENIDKKKYMLTIAAIAAFGTILRICVVLFIDCTPISDYNTIYTAAKNVAQGDFSAFERGTYFHRFPHLTVYPIVTGHLFKIFGSGIEVVKIINIIMKLISIIFISMVGKELDGRRGGITAAFMLSFFPADILYTHVAVTENFAIPFFILSLYFIIRAYKSKALKPSIINCFIAGIVLCIGTFFRGVAPFYIAAYVIGILTVFAKKTKLLSAISVVLAYFVLSNAVSLALYNTGMTKYKLSDRAVPYTVFMLIGSNFDTYGMYSAEDHHIYVETNGDVDEMNRIAIERISDRYLGNPTQIIPHFLRKTAIIWAGGDFGSVFWGYSATGYDGDKPLQMSLNLLCNCFYMILLVLSAIGVIINKDKSIICLMALIILGFEAGFLLVEVQPRYTYSAAYIFILLATCGISAYLDRSKKK